MLEVKQLENSFPIDPEQDHHDMVHDLMATL
jgi:hypothetical protein